jgi:outer membrane biogenesis lipoprotein LolB
MSRAGSCLLTLSLLVLASACAGARLTLPSDAGSALPDFATIHQELSSGCAGIRTLRAEVALAGKAHGERLRGTLAAGFRAPGDMRLELNVLPLRTPVFVLAANAQGATLLLSRDHQVIRSDRGAELLGALTGIDLAPADLMAILTGCVVPSPHPTGGRQHAGGWISIDLDGGAVLYAQRSGTRWHVRAARRGSWRIDYADWSEASRFPGSVSLTSEMPVAVDVRATLREPEANVDLGDEVFVVNIPAGTEEVPLARLRESGPLRDR